MRTLIEQHTADIWRVNADIDDKIVKLALDAAGNHYDIRDFGWRTRPDDGEYWTLVYTENRDSTLLVQSNAKVYARTLETEAFESDVHPERHSHWACGWIDGYAIRVFHPDWTLTPAFVAYAELLIKERDEYPSLDDDQYSEMEFDATMENIEDAIRRSDAWEQIDPDNMDIIVHDLFDYFWDTDQSQVESVDDTGGYPEESAVIDALLELRWILPLDYDPDTEPKSPEGYAEDDCKHWNPIMEASEPKQLILWSTLPVIPNGEHSMPIGDNPDNGEHWLASVGMYGYLPETLESFDTKQDALDFLASELDLTDDAYNWLAEYGHVDLDNGNSNIAAEPDTSIWLAEVYPCDCDDPESHND